MEGHRTPNHWFYYFRFCGLNFNARASRESVAKTHGSTGLLLRACVKQSLVALALRHGEDERKIDEQNREIAELKLLGFLVSCYEVRVVAALFRNTQVQHHVLHFCSIWLGHPG